MPKFSAGLLLFRRKKQDVEVMLVHPGGPFWAKKDAGVWSVPKGEYAQNEDPLHAAKREFKEETGSPVPNGDFIELGEVKYNNKKVVAWAIEADLDVRTIQSNTVRIEWPPKSGQQQEFPECDRAGWFSLPTSKVKLIAAQAPFIDRLAMELGVDPRVSEPEDEDKAQQLSLL